MKLPGFFSHRAKPEIVAAVDLGSNSFHMLVARIVNGQVLMQDRLREMVRLGAGLDADARLSAETQQHALACLGRFGQRLCDLPMEGVRIVGTNTLRLATNAADFLEAAEKVLNHPIEIISGREEARLIYLGVAQTLASTEEKRLVIDIGGGSTEFIIGKGFESSQRESLNMGCVSISQRFFAEGVLRPKAMRRAEIAALVELQPVEALFKSGWDIVIGASGTMRAADRVIREMGWGNEITPASLQLLRQALLSAGSIENLSLKGLSPERAPVFSGGVAVLLGIVEGLNIQRLTVSEGALREGVVYDLLGRIAHEDVRERTILGLSHRYLVDTKQAERVESTALTCLSQVAQVWDLVHAEYAQMLSWAARLHEIGLSIAHDQYHRHGAYILTYADLAGFSHRDQASLAMLVYAHQRKFPSNMKRRCPHIKPIQLVRLSAVLRLAVLLHRSRSSVALPAFTLHAADSSLKLVFPPNWLKQHPLTQADLEQEREYLQDVKLQLSYE